MIWMAFLFRASGCTVPSPTDKKNRRRKQTRDVTATALETAKQQRIDPNQSGPERRLTIAQQSHQSFMTARKCC